jgi:hypothetical protein
MDGKRRHVKKEYKSKGERLAITEGSKKGGHFIWTERRNIKRECYAREEGR